MKDERIEVEDERTISGTRFAFLRLRPKAVYACPKCGSSKCIRYGTRKREIKFPPVPGCASSTVILRFFRIRCSTCMHIFNDEPECLGSRERIPSMLKVKVLFDLKSTASFKAVAESNGIGTSTAIKIFDDHVDCERRTLPEVICVDEFRNLRSEDGKYAFLILDPMAGKVVDVLPDRRLDRLREYFGGIPFEEREKVKYFVSDMYEGYRTVATLYFPKATHIVDPFHYTRYVTDAFNRVRIRTMSSFRQSSPEYKNLKRYWRTLLKYSKEIGGQGTRFDHILGRQASASEIIDSTVNVTDELASAWALKEKFLKSARETKFEDSSKFVRDWTLEVRSSGIPEFQGLLTTFVDWEREIANSFLRFGDQRLTNAYIEGMNNRIKVIKRVSYGYRNFERFRKRIIYIINEEIRITSSI